MTESEPIVRCPDCLRYVCRCPDPPLPPFLVEDESVDWTPWVSEGSSNA